MPRLRHPLDRPSALPSAGRISARRSAPDFDNDSNDGNEPFQDLWDPDVLDDDEPQPEHGDFWLDNDDDND